MELIHFEYHKNYNLGDLVIAMGEFDGLHLAHQELIKRAINHAKKINAKSAVFSFDPHPDFVLKKRSNQGYITPLNVKIKALESLGVDYFILIPFTLEFSKILPREFEERVLNKFTIKRIVVGFDYRYGYRGSGNTETLKKHFDVDVVQQIDFMNQKMGSNEIRELLLQGKMYEVSKMLGRYYNITGRVVSGNKVGRKMGIRTANVTLEEHYQILRKGVYAVYVTINNKKHFGVCNIGNNPTVNYVEIPRLEVHVLDFDEIIYNEIISVDFVEFLRDEIKFASVNELISQINEDIMKTREILEEN